MKTKDEIEYIKNEMKNYNLPWISSSFIKFWYLIGRYIIFLVFIIVFGISIIYNSSSNIILQHKLWNLSMFLFGGVFMSITVWALLHHFIKHYSIKKKAKKLGITLEEWNMFVNELGLFVK